MKYENAIFLGKRIQVDGHQYIGCTFQQCVIIYAGGELPFISACRFSEVTLAFEGSSGATLVFMAALYNTGFHTIIENTFEDIRNNRLMTPPPPD